MSTFLRDEISEDPEIIFLWLDKLPVGLLIVDEKGVIKWANRYIGKTLGYSEYEFTKINWYDLTVSKSDTTANQEMSKRSLNNEIDEYTLMKEYRPKSGQPIPIKMIVTRYPLILKGDNSNNFFKYFLVTIAVIDTNKNELLEAIDNLSQKVAGGGQPSLGQFVESAKDWIVSKPKSALIISIIIGTLFWGSAFIGFLSRVLEALKLFGPGASP